MFFHKPLQRRLSFKSPPPWVSTALCFRSQRPPSEATVRQGMDSTRELLWQVVGVQPHSCVWLCSLMDWSTRGFPVLHQLPGFAQTRVHWLDILATWCEELTHWKRSWCWEGLRAGGEGGNRGWDGWMASLTQWTWAWVDSWSRWWTGRPGVLRFMGSQRIRHDWATELNWTDVHWVIDAIQPSHPLSSGASLFDRSSWE